MSGGYNDMLEPLPVGERSSQREAESSEGKNWAPCLGCAWVAFILAVAGISAHRHLLPKIPPGAHAHHAPPTPPAGGTTVINVIGGQSSTTLSCGQVTMASTYFSKAVAFAKGKGWVGSAGSCASQGYTVAAGTKALPASLTGYTGHPLTAQVYTFGTAPPTPTPAPSCPCGFTCFKDGAAFVSALNAPASAGDKLALVCPAASPCVINGTLLGLGGGVKATVIMEHVLLQNNVTKNARLLSISGGNVTGTKLTFRNGQATP